MIITERLSARSAAYWILVESLYNEFTRNFSGCVYVHVKEVSSMKTRYILLAVVTILVVVLSSCGIQTETPPVVDQGAVETSVAATVAALSTQ